MTNQIRVLVVGLGNMGMAHALAYHHDLDFEIVGLCARNIKAIQMPCAALENYPHFNNYETALKETEPDAVCISTWPDTHAAFAHMAFKAGAHVFLEKPIAPTVEESKQVIAAARTANKKLVVGYILRHHPSWTAFVKQAKKLGKPLVMRMNLNQQSVGDTWRVHKKLMESLPPIVDCGVHYVDVMCQMTNANPISVHAIGVRLSNEIAENMYNYGHLQVTFDDGSVGWYEVGWGPMMSETAFFIKDIIGPKGSVSIVAQEHAYETRSDNVDSHTKANALHVHYADVDERQNFTVQDQIITLSDEPDHNELCAREQVYFAQIIKQGLNLDDHWRYALNSLRIVLAADQSIREGDVVRLRI